jgi:DNA-binding transcriptional LysR family regulator
MNNRTSWDDHRYFLAIARSQSLTGAAKLLGVSQPTVSRRLDAMEKSFKARLFQRTRVGYELTPVGAELFQTVSQIEEQLIEADRRVLGRDAEMSGPLRFTSTPIFIDRYLGPHIWNFLANHKDIDFRLICTQSTLSISRREADIAVRIAENPPETLIGRRLGTIAYGVYAAVDHAHAFATVEAPENTWIGLHDEDLNRLIYDTFLPGTRVRHRTDSMAALHAMVGAGLGVSILPCFVADTDPKLVRVVEPVFTDPKFDIWLLYHPDTRHTRRLRLFADFVSDRIRADEDLFNGRRTLRQSLHPSD